MVRPLFQKGVPMEKPKKNTVRVITLCVLAFCLCTRTVLALENTFDESEENIEETSGSSEPFTESEEETEPEEDENRQVTEDEEASDPAAEITEDETVQEDHEIYEEETGEEIADETADALNPDDPDANEPIIKINSANNIKFCHFKSKT